jgi:MFS family permease
VSRPDLSAARATGTRHWLGPAIALFACGWGGNQFTPLVSLYVTDLGWSSAVASTLFLAYVAGLIPGFLLGGGLSDRFGRRIVVAAVVVTGVASIMLAVGPLWEPLLFAGRIVVGLGLGCAMSTGATWVRELSSPPYDTVGDPQRAARRSSMWLTAGFALGPVTAGAVAQWGPLPLVVPYIVHIVVVVAALVALRGVPETVTPAAEHAAMARQPIFVDANRFLRVVVPVAPWVFGVMAVAFIVTPTELAPQLGSSTVIFSTLLTLCALLSGFFIQPVARRFVARAGSGVAADEQSRRSGAVSLRLILTALAIAAAGCLIALVVVGERLVWLAPLAAIVLGAAYGILMVSGLSEAQAAASPRHTGTATAVFYSLAYLGFVIPTAFTVLTAFVDAWVLMAALAGLALLMALAVRLGTGRRSSYS